MEALLDRCLHRRPPTVLVVGDIMCDSHLLGKVSRVSPEAPVPIFESGEQRRTLGGAANVAANLRALGCEVQLIGVIGTDVTGYRIRDLLRQQGIADTWLLEDATRPTTEKVRLIAQQQHVLRLDQESRHPIDSDLITQALEYAAALLADVDGMICSDYQKGLCMPELIKPLFAMAQAADRPILVDPKKWDFTYYQGATILTPNLKEVEQASGAGVDSEEALEKAANTLLHQSQARALLVTRGKDGMTLFHPPHAPLHVAARARDVFDVTGAGDTAIATLGMAVASGLSLSEAVYLANTAAGVVVGKMGTAVVSPQELRTALRSEEGFHAGKVLQRDALAAALLYHRQQGERIVFTNGCFDLLHVGHIHYLQQAAVLGDRLVIGVNDDASVRLLKGEGRPMIAQEDRSRVLAALACVDYVTIFSESTPLALIDLIRPDVLVKGGDYTLETVVGRKEVEAYGGSVHLVPYINGSSTTGIIESIVQHYR